jgi:hypothetical protein
MAALIESSRSRTQVAVAVRGREGDERAPVRSNGDGRRREQDLQPPLL